MALWLESEEESRNVEAWPIMRRIFMAFDINSEVKIKLEK